MEQLDTPLSVTALLQFEFTQAVRFEVFRHTKDHTKGYGELEGMTMIARFEADLDRGVMAIVPCDIVDVLRRATRISENHTIRRGPRAFDILHVATALSLGAEEFLTFDPRQRALAEAEGLKIVL